MRVDPQKPDWSRRMTSLVGQRLRERRSRLGLSAQEVSTRTADLGHEVKRALIADMENGRRPVLPVADLLVLAEALAMPPMMLLFPPVLGDDVEPLPGVASSSSSVLDWMEGLAPLPSMESDDGGVWVSAARPLRRRRDYRDLAAQAREAARKLEALITKAEQKTGAEGAFYADRLAAPAQELTDLLVDLRIHEETAAIEGFSLPDVLLPGDDVWLRMRELWRERDADQNPSAHAVGE